MKRDNKEKLVAWLRDEFVGVKALFLTDFRSLTVSEMNQLRSELRRKGIKFKVLKNTLVRRAYADTDVSAIDEDLRGPRAGAWAYSEDDVPGMAKILTDFAKTHPNLKLVRGVLKGKLVDPSEMESLSKLPPREELLGRLLGTMIAPVGGFVNTLAAIPRSFLYALKAIEEQKSGAQASQ